MKQQQTQLQTLAKVDVQALSFSGSKRKLEESFKLALSCPSLERELVDSLQSGGVSKEVGELKTVPTKKIHNHDIVQTPQIDL